MDWRTDPVRVKAAACCATLCALSRDAVSRKTVWSDAVQSELYRQRLAYASVAQRDAPLARASQLDSTYFNSVPNRGAMFWRLVDRRLGRDVLMAVICARFSRED
jgi:hypothetical protein